MLFNLSGLSSRSSIRLVLETEENKKQTEDRKQSYKLDMKWPASESYVSTLAGVIMKDICHEIIRSGVCIISEKRCIIWLQVTHEEVNIHLYYWSVKEIILFIICRLKGTLLQIISLDGAAIQLGC